MLLNLGGRAVEVALAETKRGIESTNPPDLCCDLIGDYFTQNNKHARTELWIAPMMIFLFLTLLFSADCVCGCTSSTDCTGTSPSMVGLSIEFCFLLLLMLYSVLATDCSFHFFTTFDYMFYATV